MSNLSRLFSPLLGKRSSSCNTTVESSLIRAPGPDSSGVSPDCKSTASPASSVSFQGAASISTESLLSAPLSCVSPTILGLSDSQAICEETKSPTVDMDTRLGVLTTGQSRSSSSSSRASQLTTHSKLLLDLVYKYEQFLSQVSVVMTGFSAWLGSRDASYVHKVGQKRVEELAQLVNQCADLVHSLHREVVAEELENDQGLVEQHQKAGLSRFQTSMAIAAAGLLGAVGGAFAAPYILANTALASGGGSVIASSLTALGVTVSNINGEMNVGDLLKRMEDMLGKLKQNLDDLHVSVRNLDVLMEVPDNDKPHVIAFVKTIQDVVDQGRELSRQLELKQKTG